jgi:CrcB protein
VKGALAESLWVGIGGFAGAVLRYGLSGVVHRQFPLTSFPLGTLAVNLIGCLMIGYLAGLADSRQLFGPSVRAFTFIGVLGGFTTFSTFGYETVAMARDGDALRAALNVGAHVVCGLAAVWIAYGLASAR